MKTVPPPLSLMPPLYIVSLWAEHPNERDGGSDPVVFTSHDWLTASKVYADPDSMGWEASALIRGFDDVWVQFNTRAEVLGLRQLKGPVRDEEIGNRSPFIPPTPPKERKGYDADRHERAMLAGMEGGCDAYNDAMGWGE